MYTTHTQTHTQIYYMHIFALACLLNTASSSEKKTLSFFRPLSRKSVWKKQCTPSASKWHQLFEMACYAIVVASVHLRSAGKWNVVIYWLVMMYKTLLTFQSAIFCSLAHRSTPSQSNL